MKEELEKALNEALRQAGLDTYYSVNQTVANRLVNTRALKEFLAEYKPLPVLEVDYIEPALGEHPDYLR